jgi:spermidine synthase
VLVLGLAAGSVARAVRALDPRAVIVGVERDAEVLRAARGHFGLDRLGIEVVEDDALAFLRKDRRSFDLVIEDVFVGTARRVRKPGWLFEEGYPLAYARLRTGGLLVSNTIEELPAVVRALRPCHGRMVSLDVRDYWNRVLVCGRPLPPPRVVRSVLAAHPLLAPLVRQLSLRAL